MAFKLGEVVNGEPANIIDNVGTMEEPVIWMSKKHKGDNTSVHLKNTTSLPDLVGYINMESGYSPTYDCYFAVGNYGAEIWRSDPNKESNRGQLDPFYPHEHPSLPGQVLSKHQGNTNRKITTAMKGTTAGVGGTGGRMLAVGQGLHVHGNPMLGLSGVTRRVILTRPGPNNNYLESFYNPTLYGTYTDVKEAQLVNELQDGDLGWGGDNNTDETFGTPALSGGGQFDLPASYSPQKQFAIGCDRVVIGNPESTDINGIYGTGKVYIYDLSMSTCIAEIQNPAAGDSSIVTSKFGWTVEIADGYIFVGDPYYTDSTFPMGNVNSSGSAVGAVYIYDLNGNLVHFIDPKQLSDTVTDNYENLNKTPRDLDTYSSVSDVNWDEFPFSDDNLGKHYNNSIFFGAGLAAGGGKLVVGAPNYRTFTTGSGTRSYQSCITGAVFLFNYGSNSKGGLAIDDIGTEDEATPGSYIDINYPPYGHGIDDPDDFFYTNAPNLKPVAWTFPSWYYGHGYHENDQDNYYQPMYMGQNLAISSQYIIVGCPDWDKSAGQLNRGTAMFFDHSLTYLGRVEGQDALSGIEDAYSTNWDATNFSFGRSVAAQGNTIVVGSRAGGAAVYTHEQYINIHDAIALENGWH